MIKILKNIFINEDDILFIDRCDRKTLIHTSSIIYETYLPVKEIEKELSSNFIKINKALIVNKTHIKRIEGSKYILDNNEIIWGAVRKAGYHRRLMKELKGYKFIKK